MDASAFVSKAEWDEILHRNMCDEVDIRDNRYHQVVHMVTSAKGAEAYYTIGESVDEPLAAGNDPIPPLEHHSTRLEGLEEARDRDTKAAEAWIGEQ